MHDVEKCLGFLKKEKSGKKNPTKTLYYVALKHVLYNTPESCSKLCWNCESYCCWFLSDLGFYYAFMCTHSIKVCWGPPLGNPLPLPLLLDAITSLPTTGSTSPLSYSLQTPGTSDFITHPTLNPCHNRTHLTEVCQVFLLNGINWFWNCFENSLSTLLCHSLDLKKNIILVELCIANVKQITFNNLDESRI